MGKQKEAIVAYDQCINMRPLHPWPIFERGEIYEELGETNKAYEDMITVINIQPEHEMAIRKKAKLAAEKKLWLETIQTIDSLLALNPDDIELRLTRAKAFSRVCKWEEALQDANYVARMSPGTAEVFYLRGCLLRNRNYQKAVEDFSVSLLLDSSERNKNAFICRAFTFMKMKMYDASAMDFYAGKL